MLEKFSKTLEFLQEKLIRILKAINNLNPNIVGKVRQFSIHLFHTIKTVIRDYKEDKIGMRAASLTFLTLLSIVPVLAMIFGIAKGFGLDELLNNELQRIFSDQKEILEQVTKFANSMLKTTSGGFIAGTGLLVLFWTVLQLFNSVEESFNQIWGIKKSRVFMRKFANYFTIMLFAPIVIIVASSLTLIVATFIKTHVESNQFLRDYAGHIMQIVQWVPYSLMLILLTLLYWVIPNTKVSFKAALIAGILAGSAYQITQWGYINFQVGFSRYNAIYGSFAALPLFLVWLQLSWFIILIGAELSFAIQYVSKSDHVTESLKLSHSFRIKLSIMIFARIVKQFIIGQKALNDVEISEELKLPIKVVRDIINDLQQINLLSVTVGSDPMEVYYQPAQDVSDLHISAIILKLENLGLKEFKNYHSVESDRINDILSEFEKVKVENAKDLLIKDI